VATDSQGVTLTWAGSSQAEVVSLSIDGASSQFVETTSRLNSLRVRDYRPHDIDPGTVSRDDANKGQPYWCHVWCAAGAQHRAWWF
jgi:hypothetical protein